MPLEPSFKVTVSGPTSIATAYSGRSAAEAKRVYRTEQKKLRAYDTAFLLKDDQPMEVTRWNDNGEKTVTFLPDHSKVCMTTRLLSGDPECPACGEPEYRPKSKVLK